MTNSNKILLKALLDLEAELFKSQKILENSNLFFSIQFDFKHIYDLFEVIISSFNVPETNYDALYNLLNELYYNNISSNEAIENIEFLIQ